MAFAEPAVPLAPPLINLRLPSLAVRLGLEDLQAERRLGQINDGVHKRPHGEHHGARVHDFARAVQSQRQVRDDDRAHEHEERQRVRGQLGHDVGALAALLLPPPPGEVEPAERDDEEAHDGHDLPDDLGGVDEALGLVVARVELEHPVEDHDHPDDGVRDGHVEARAVAVLGDVQRQRGDPAEAGHLRAPVRRLRPEGELEAVGGLGRPELHGRDHRAREREDEVGDAHDAQDARGHGHARAVVVALVRGEVGPAHGRVQRVLALADEVRGLAVAPVFVRRVRVRGRRAALGRQVEQRRGRGHAADLAAVVDGRQHGRLQLATRTLLLLERHDLHHVAGAHEGRHERGQELRHQLAVQQRHVAVVLARDGVDADVDAIAIAAEAEAAAVAAGHGGVQELWRWRACSG
ncbi:hypothetical protein ON010_g14910 [Phytophthora cinnamomi]|nr:hypothetical protein ON010_g14910 [Phytophthora cinnamomi]